VTWSWDRSLFPAVCSIPAGAVALRDPVAGLSLSFGVLAAAAVGVTPTRSRRVLVLVVGAVIGLSLVLGSLLGSTPALAVAVLFAACVAAAVSAARHPLGRLAVLLAVPLVAAGFSYQSPADSVPSALLIVTGSALAWLVSLVWPTRPVPHPEPAALPSHESMVRYGVRLGAAGAVCAAAGFAFGFDHAGWAAAACLLVMRPSAEQTRLRAAGRAVFVTAGAALAVAVASLDGPAWILAALLVLDLVALGATRGSRWYLTGGFTTFIVLSMLAWSQPGTDWFLQRLVETTIGVAVALLATLATPGIAP
jgi:uncharacterized membrane protein YccC